MQHNIILKNVSRFINLNEEEKQLYVSLLSTRKLKKKEHLLRQGETARYDYFVTQGCLKSYQINDNGSEHITMFAVQDWWTGDLSSFIQKQPSNYFIQALEDSEVLQISKDNYDILFEKIPKFERFYRILYQRSLVSFIQQSDQNISLSAEERFHQFNKKYPTLLNRISQKNIAAYLGVTPEFLSLMRRRLLTT